MAGLLLKNISKTYDKKEWAVSNFTLEIEDGEFIVLAGPAGCGKTSLLRIIAGIEKPTEGELYIGGENAANIGAAERNIAMVFQPPALFRAQTVYGNLAYGLLLRNLPQEVIEERVKEAAEAFGLESLLSRRAKTLSRFESKKIEIARAFARRPKILLLDEPLSGFQPVERAQIISDIAKLRYKLGATTIYAASDPSDAVIWGGRVALIIGGRLEQAGTAEEIFK